MRKYIVLALTVLMVLGLMGGVVMAEDEVNNDDDFDVDYMAAPAVAGMLLEAAGVDNRYGTGRDGGNFIRDVAHHMDGTDFSGVCKTDVIAYECAVAEFLNDPENGEHYPANVVCPCAGIIDPEASGAEFVDNEDGTGTMTVTVVNLCGNGIEGLGMEDIEIDLPLLKDIRTLSELDSGNYWSVSLVDQGDGLYDVTFVRLAGTMPYVRIGDNAWGVIVDGVDIGKVDVKVSLEAVLQSVVYEGEGDTFGSHVNDTLTFTFTNDIFVKDEPLYVYINGDNFWFPDDGKSYYTLDDNILIITIGPDGTYSRPRPSVGDYITGFDELIDALGNPVVVPVGGVKVTQ